MAARLRSEGRAKDEAIARLHALLLRAARFECARRRPTLPHLRGNDLDDIANQAADDALVSVLARLDDFRGASRFTTWVYKFALLEAAVKLRKRSWQGREVPLEPETWSLFTSAGIDPDEEVEQSELLTTLQEAIADVLTPHQRRVLVALALNGVPIDVLAERLSTNRGALTRRCTTRGASCAGTSTSKVCLFTHYWRRRTDGATGTQASTRPAPRTRRAEVGCDVCFDELDRYVELEVAGRTPTPPSPACARTWKGCPACREEHESLYALVSGEQAL